MFMDVFSNFCQIKTLKNIQKTACFAKICNGKSNSSYINLIILNYEFKIYNYYKMVQAEIYNFKNSKKEDKKEKHGCALLQAKISFSESFTS